jgi:hypothetical protein
MFILQSLFISILVKNVRNNGEIRGKQLEMGGRRKKLAGVLHCN